VIILQMSGEVTNHDFYQSIGFATNRVSHDLLFPNIILP
jgi:hypothetical protein